MRICFKVFPNYRELINCTRPDITYTINRLSRYNNLNRDHGNAIVGGLRYIQVLLIINLHLVVILMSSKDIPMQFGYLIGEIKLNGRYVFILGGLQFLRNLSSEHA